jgi:hypothetical protein
MCRTIIFYLIAVTVVCGCAGKSPVSPGSDLLVQASAANVPGSDGPYRLWGEWTWYINAAHDQIEVVPKREGRFHLNAMKFLESYCTDCLKILAIKNNGDGTVDISVEITHPFKGHPEYTGFDVKGILMFSGSYEYQSVFTELPPYPEPYRISWRLKGDPEVMNPDGWTMRWSPTWDSGSDMPIFNYWPGKFSVGTPTANLNGFKNFYTSEERHMFAVDSSVERTYTVWLPFGKPIVAGYAVEACWEPATKQPVTDPLNDFPYSANQPEPYLFNLIVNNGNPITDDSCCGKNPLDCSDIRFEYASWGGIPIGDPPDANTYICYIRPTGYGESAGVGPLLECSPEIPGSYWESGDGWGDYYENGDYRCVVYCFDSSSTPLTNKNGVPDIYDFTVAKE